MGIARRNSRIDIALSDAPHGRWGINCSSDAPIKVPTRCDSGKSRIAVGDLLFVAYPYCIPQGDNARMDAC